VKYTIKATGNGRLRFFTTYKLETLILKIKELKKLGYRVEVK